ncbi:MAG: hypothetical protein ACT4OE_04610 [Sphingosinicella sp.]
MYAWFHIACGTVALLSGAVAILMRKGSGNHARWGTIFFVSMLGMAGSGAVIAALKPERGTMLIGLFTCYLVLTSWVAARKRKPAGRAFEWAGFLVALAIAATFVLFAAMAAQNPNGRLDSLPAAVHYPFAFLASLAALLDLNHLVRGEPTQKQRIARHLWRMGVAFLIAAMSFFLGQQKVMPEWIVGPWLNLPQLLIFATMLYWIFRMRFGRGLRGKPAARAVPAPALRAAENYA